VLSLLAFSSSSSDLVLDEDELDLERCNARACSRFSSEAWPSPPQWLGTAACVSRMMRAQIERPSTVGRRSFPLPMRDRPGFLLASLCLAISKFMSPSMLPLRCPEYSTARLDGESQLIFSEEFRFFFSWLLTRRAQKWALLSWLSREVEKEGRHLDFRRFAV
jgi:hypothetical protein